MHASGLLCLYRKKSDSVRILNNLGRGLPYNALCKDISALGLVGLYKKIFLFILIIPFGCHGNQISAWNEIL
jgi:hypothetical protein